MNNDNHFLYIYSFQLFNSVSLLWSLKCVCKDGVNNDDEDWEAENQTSTPSVSLVHVHIPTQLKGRSKGKDDTDSRKSDYNEKSSGLGFC